MIAAVGVGRQAEGQQRHERAGGRGVVGGLGSGDALDGALAELLGVLGELALGHVGQEGRDLGAARGEGAEGEAEGGAAQPRLPRAAPVVAAHPRRPTGMTPAALRRRWAATQSASPTAKRPTATTTTSMPSASCGDPEGQPLLAGHLVDADEADGEADEQGGEAADAGAAEHGADRDEGEQHDGEVLRRAEADRELHDLRREQGQQQRADGAGDEGADGGRGERLRGPAGLGHLVALDGRDDRGGLARGVEQDRGRRAAVHAAVEDAGEHDEAPGSARGRR